MADEPSAEDRLIARHFAPIATHPGALGLGDDAAFIKPPPGCDLVLKTDAIIGGVHFFPEDAAADVARKALRVNLSDLAAKGAKPLGFLLSLALPADIGVLKLVPLETGGAAPRLTESAYVRFRRGGESLKLDGGAHTRELRDLLQEAGIPPWQRSRMPLVFDDDGALIAVADLWTSESGAERLVRAKGRLEWSARIGPDFD